MIRKHSFNRFSATIKIINEDWGEKKKCSIFNFNLLNNQIGTFLSWKPQISYQWNHSSRMIFATISLTFHNSLQTQKRTNRSKTSSILLGSTRMKRLKANISRLLIVCDNKWTRNDREKKSPEFFDSSHNGLNNEWN